MQYARLTAGQLGLVKPTLDVVCETLAALGEGLNADPLDPQARGMMELKLMGFGGDCGVL